MLSACAQPDSFTHESTSLITPMTYLHISSCVHPLYTVSQRSSSASGPASTSTSITWVMRKTPRRACFCSSATICWASKVSVQNTVRSEEKTESERRKRKNMHNIEASQGLAKRANSNNNNNNNNNSNKRNWRALHRSLLQAFSPLPFRSSTACYLRSFPSGPIFLCIIILAAVVAPLPISSSPPLPCCSSSSHSSRYSNCGTDECGLR